MSWTVIAILIVVGLVLLVIEVLVIPGVGVAGIFGMAAIVTAVWQAYVTHGSVAGHYTVAGLAILTFFTLFLSIRSKTWTRAMLASSIDSKVNVIEEQAVHPGDQGKTVSRLAPAGKALINNNYYEVRTKGEFVDQNQEIEVLEISFNKIIVKPKTTEL